MHTSGTGVMKSSRTEVRSTSQVIISKKPQQLAETTHQFKGMCEEAQQKLADLTSTGGLLTQLPAFISEYQSLLKLKEVYEFRFCLLSMENLRLNGVITDMRHLSQDAVRQREEIQRIMEADKRRCLEEQLGIMTRNHESEMNSLMSSHERDVRAWELRSRQLEAELEKSRAEGLSYKGRFEAEFERVNALRVHIDALEGKLQQADLRTKFEAEKIRKEWESRLGQLQAQATLQLQDLRKESEQAARNRESEWEREKGDFLSKIHRLETEYTQSKKTSDQKEMETRELLAALKLAESKLSNRERDLASLNDQLGRFQNDYDANLSQLKESFQEQFLKERAARENDKREKEKEVASLKKTVSTWEDKVRNLESTNQQLRDALAQEKQTNSSQSAKLEREKAEESKKLRIELQTQTEIWLQDKLNLEGFIEDLQKKMQIQKATHQGELDHERHKSSKLAQEIENWREGFNTIEELKAKKQAEIEQYESKYKGYLRPEEAKQLKEDYARLRGQSKLLEDENRELNQQVEDLRKRLQVLDIDLVAKIKKAENLEKSLQDKKHDLEEIEGRYHAQIEQARILGQSKDDAENQIIILRQRMIDLEAELRRVTSERDGIHSSYEELKAKYSEFTTEMNKEISAKPEEFEMLKKHLSQQQGYTVVRQSTRMTQSAFYSSNSQTQGHPDQTGQEGFGRDSRINLQEPRNQ